ncbi:hypothetical protein DM02DRAFT_614813 [Periconia macrospinosa]|uniref:BTB domain-containing protein n=1 Tax=Periconia macrospinosa TaxID=97972 RepID=A0A2V1DPF0_9PLEO|nr:hypothetical protein DM02DRAFT_614813 [Periconia macrospinosa]
MAQSLCDSGPSPPINLSSPPSLSSATPPPQPTIELSSSADVTLVIGEEKQLVRASVPALRNASSVWAAMFSGRWAESDTSEIAFPDDDIEAMLLVLRIAHIRFNEIPKKEGLSFQLLLDVAFVCDKYDLVHMVRPFLDLHNWAQPYSYPNYEGEGYPAWLFIAWTFGYADSFDRLARDLALSAKIQLAVVTKEIEDTWVTEDGHDIVQATLPPEIFESILQVRQSALVAGLEALYTILDGALKATKCLAKTKDNKPIEAPECRAEILRTLLPQLRSKSLYPERVQATSYRSSVLYLQFMVETIKIGAHNSYYDGAYISHNSCAALLDFSSAIQKAVDQMPTPTLESHRRHMEEQAKK